VGYAGYSRDHEGWAEPAQPRLSLSGDVAFGGSAERLDPEQLVVLAAASCQLLSFLAVAARARIDVVAYQDDAVGDMPERGSKSTSIETIGLRPRIEVRGDASVERVRRLVELAHQECYVANSLHTTITVEPTITFVRDGE
jgi:organic hydroperoxide reductase OsmC/OhrA